MAVTTLHTRARSAKSTTRQALPASPPWLLPVGRYLKSLGLDPIQLSEVCRFLTKNGKTSGNMTLKAEHAEQVDALISGRDFPSIRQAIASPAPVKFVTASTDETPHDPEAYIATESDWNDCRQLFDRSPKPDERPVKPRPIAATLPPSYRSQTSSAWMIPEDVAERIARTSLVGHFG